MEADQAAGVTPAGDAAGIPEPTAEDERVLIYLDEMLKDWKSKYDVPGQMCQRCENRVIERKSA